MPSDADKRIFQDYMALESALTSRVVYPEKVADAINRLIDAHVQRAVEKIAQPRSTS